jgi:hypothetical protein
MNRRPTIIAGALAAGLAAAPAAAADHVRIEHEHQFSTRTPSAPAGRSFTTTYLSTADPAAKPPPLSHVRFELPDGGRFDTGAVPQCTATDAQIMVQGSSACEPGSTLGAGELTVDTGFPEPNRMLVNDLTFVNARDALIIVARERRTGAYVVVRGVVGERTLDIDVPPLPGAPPEGGANRYETVSAPAVTGPGGAYMTTPSTCPPDGAWMLRTTYTFRGGEQVVGEDRSPCDAPAVASPSQRITFFRRQRGRAGRDGALRLRARRAARGTVQISRGGQPLLRRSVQLTAGLNRVELPALARGRYLLSVQADGFTRRARLTVR